jgi:hypothetical protein
LARVETGIIIARHVPCATHDIIDVLAERGSLGRVLASAETKLVGGNKILPCEKPVDEPSWKRDETFSTYRPLVYLLKLTGESG